jgi:hypothetical protein
MVATLVPFDESLSGWERALHAFVAEEERRSGSRRTVEGSTTNRSLQRLRPLSGRLLPRGYVGQAACTGSITVPRRVWMHPPHVSMRGETPRAHCLRRAFPWP